MSGSITGSKALDRSRRNSFRSPWDSIQVKNKVWKYGPVAGYQTHAEWRAGNGRQSALLSGQWRRTTTCTAHHHRQDREDQGGFRPYLQPVRGPGHARPARFRGLLLLGRVHRSVGPFQRALDATWSASHGKAWSEVYIQQMDPGSIVIQPAPIQDAAGLHHQRPGDHPKPRR